MPDPKNYMPQGMTFVRGHVRRSSSHRSSSKGLFRFIAMVVVLVIALVIIGNIFKWAWEFFVSGGWVYLAFLFIIAGGIWWIRRERKWCLYLTDHDWHNIAYRHLKKWCKTNSDIKSGKVLVGKVFTYRLNIYTNKYQVRLRERYPSSVYRP